MMELVYKNENTLLSANGRVSQKRIFVSNDADRNLNNIIVSGSKTIETINEIKSSIDISAIAQPFEYLRKAKESDRKLINRLIREGFKITVNI